MVFGLSNFEWALLANDSYRRYAEVQNKGKL
jgi:hypothetical protein